MKKKENNFGNRYCCFLRGVNVNGIKIKNKELVDVFNNLGFKDINTVLQTGNVIFSLDLKSKKYKEDMDELKVYIEKGLKEAFNYDAFVIIKTLLEIQNIVSNFSLKKHEDFNSNVIFTSNEVIKEELKKCALDSEVEEVSIFKDVIFWNVKKGYTLHSIFGKNLGKKKYKEFTTTRNINTLERILKK